MTLPGMFDVGTVVELVPTAFSGFAYAVGRKQRLALLGVDAMTGGNEVLQESAKPYREATLTVVAETDDDKDTLRGYDETSEAIGLVDDFGQVRIVRVLSCTTTKVPGGTLWDCALLLMELTAPVVEGS